MRPFKPKRISYLDIDDPNWELTSWEKPWMLRFEIAKSRHQTMLNCPIRMYCSRAFESYEVAWAYYKQKEASIETRSWYCVLHIETTFDVDFAYKEGGGF